MKNSNLLILVISFSLILVATTAKAQLEVKIDPVDIFFRSPKLSVEYGINESVGVELVGSLRYGEKVYREILSDRELHKGYSLRVIGKLYGRSGLRGICGGIYAGQVSFTSYSTDANIAPFTL